MKIKVGLLFLVIAVVFVYLVFTGGYLKKSGVGPSAKKIQSEAIIKAFNELDLLDYSGKNFTLQDNPLTKQDKIVVHLWASWCGPCVNEVPELVEYSKKNTGIKFVIVSLDDFKEDIDKFLKSFPEFNNKNHIQIWDTQKSIANLLQADRLPMSVLIDPNSDEPRVIKAVVDWKTVNF
jgi:thiol-disulfide isomerase/thioredoxin